MLKLAFKKGEIGRIAYGPNGWGEFPDYTTLFSIILQDGTV
jgi:hypothetical protein